MSTSAQDVNVGDVIRLTVKPGPNAGQVTVKRGAFTIEGPAYCPHTPGNALFVGGFPLRGWGNDAVIDIKVLKRALPPEPPVGSIVAGRQMFPYCRTTRDNVRGDWRKVREDGCFTWQQVVDDLAQDLQVLREGWGDE